MDSMTCERTFGSAFRTSDAPDFPRWPIEPFVSSALEHRTMGCFESAAQIEKLLRTNFVVLVAGRC